MRASTAFCFLLTGLLKIDSALTLISLPRRDDSDGLFFFVILILLADYMNYEQDCLLHARVSALPLSVSSNTRNWARGDRYSFISSTFDAWNRMCLYQERPESEAYMKKTEITKRLAAMIIVVAAKALAEEQSLDRRIIVSIPDRKVALVESGTVVKVWPVAVGAPATPSPEGEFVIEARLKNPTWYGPHKIVPPGRSNPLGTRWLGLSKAGYGIHGTSNPSSIGRNVSHGCIRMKNQNVEELFELVRVGDRVELHGERDAVVAGVFSEPAAGETAAAGGGQ